MRVNSAAYRFLVIVIAMFIAFGAQAQSKKQQELEERRQELKKEISQLNNLLFKGKKEQKSVLTNVDNLDYKVSVLKNLISITNQQANLLTREINENQKKISLNRDKLKLLKEEYAAMIVKSYKSKSEQSKVMFLLSSADFQQAYKRLQYIKQYADHQKKQGEEIKVQTQKLQELNINLSKQKEAKQKLITENKVAKRELESELKLQESMVANLRKELNKYTSQIKTKQKQVDKIDKEIEKIIRAAMAKSNTKAGKSSKSKTFALTPEQKVLAANFTSNKGKLPWPVEKGVVKVRYGTKPSPIDPRIKIKSNGVRIATNKSEKVRAVFEGTVHTIMTPKNGNKVVMLQHGNYFTVYKNLSKIYVKKGDKVSTKQDIGEVLTSKATNETILAFSIFKDGKTQNPSSWIFRL
ncbi:MAG: peptidoglycan DD-metalloendopeptidase family protein [Flavobacteriaceae bacterium]|nr:peptidoglycan DD-metalloendopeptidase family protein [Bacteroidia bacterium]NNK82898.1 peptidoglycan DD-metalloendopeptidase family protein [Flavobacteriaceae bacterium]